MSLSHEHVGLKILAKIKIYILSRAKLLLSVWDEIPCRYIFYCPWNQNVLEKCYCCRLFFMFKSDTLYFLFGCEFLFIKYLFDDKHCIFFWNWGIDRSVFDIRSAQKEYDCNLCLVMGTNFVLAEFLEGWRIVKEYQCNLLGNVCFIKIRTIHKT